MGFFDSIVSAFTGNYPEQQKTAVTSAINQTLNTMIENNTKNISTSINKTITSVTSEMVSNNTAITANDSAAVNVIDGGVINLGEGANVKINQKADIKAEVKAVHELASSTDQLSQLSTGVQQGISNQAATDTGLQATLSQTAALENLKSDKNSIGSMVGDVTDKLASIFGGGAPLTSTNVSTTINNTINNNISNTTINETTIEKIIEDHFSNNVSLSNMSQCLNNITAANILKFTELNAGKGANATVDQSATVTTAVSCVTKSMNVSKLISEMTSKDNFTQNNDTSNKTQVKAAADQEAKQTNSTVKEDTSGKDIGSILSKLLPFGALNNPTMIMGPSACCCCCCLLMIGFSIYFSMRGNSSNSQSNIDTNQNNNNNNESNVSNEDTNNTEESGDESNNQSGGKIYLQISKFIKNNNNLQLSDFNNQDLKTFLFKIIAFIGNLLLSFDIIEFFLFIIVMTFIIILYYKK